MFWNLSEFFQSSCTFHIPSFCASIFKEGVWHTPFVLTPSNWWGFLRRAGRSYQHQLAWVRVPPCRLWVFDRSDLSVFCFASSLSISFIAIKRQLICMEIYQKSKYNQGERSNCNSFRCLYFFIDTLTQSCSNELLSWRYKQDLNNVWQRLK